MNTSDIHTDNPVVTDSQIEQFQEEGYFVLESVVPSEHLELLREECQRFIAVADAEMDALSTDTLGITHRGKRYFINKCAIRSPKVSQFAYSNLTAEICRTTLGDSAYLFNDQYVVKYAEVGTKFAWHQDSGYVGRGHKPYVSLWCPLDDVSIENGTVYILPFSKAGGCDIVEHVQEEDTNDLVGYHGDEPGTPVIAPAGSVVVFSSVAFHRSGPNTTTSMRRVYLAQYSSEVILKTGSNHPYILAETFIRGGVRIR